MIPEGLPTLAPIDRLAIISASTGSLSVLSLCIAAAPIPLTGYVCFPAATLLGTIAVVAGMTSLYQLRSGGARGRALAAIGTAMGVLVVTVEICLGVVAIALASRLAGLMHP